jgi:predicted metal-dependent phosphoesterase TrpH
MTRKGDLHIHTNVSDGRYTPREITVMAKDAGMNVISITDHDTTKALKDASSFCNILSLKFVPGIEISTIYKNEDVHVLGYFNGTSYENPILQSYICDMYEIRKKRARKIVDNLNIHFNIKLDYAAILTNAKGIIARPHIAKAIIDAGYNYSWKYIFKNLIGNNSPAYVPNKKLNTKDGIKLLKSVNALVVLAHPVLIKNLDLNELLEMDFDGLEAIYYSNTDIQTMTYKTTAKDFKKFITAGSDFHGLGKENGSHAPSVGAVYLEENDLDIFLTKLAYKTNS